MRLVRMLKSRASVPGHDGGVVQQVEQATPVASEHDLLLGALDMSGEMDVVGFFKLLPGLRGVR